MRENARETSRRYLPAAAVSCSLLILFSCSTWRNFTTYFNVYYDAKRHLQTYEEKLAESQTTQSGAAAVVTVHRWLDEEYEARKSSKSRGLNPPPIKLFGRTTELTNRVADTKNLDSAIQLGSKILAEKHPTDYVEGSLYIVGKALYYKNDFNGARRKFRELLFQFPNTEYAPEVGRLLTKTLLSTRQYDSATTAILKALERAESSGSKTDRAETYKMYSELLLFKGSDNLSLAADALEKAEQSLDADEAARIAFERGALLYLEGKWDAAASAFDRSIGLTRDPFVEGETKIALALSERRKQNYERALALLDEVIAKVRYEPSHPAANYERAVTIEQMQLAKSKGNYRDAYFTQKIYPPIQLAYFVLDTTYRNVSQAIMVRSRFRQAELFRVMGEYDSAARVASIIIGTKDFSSQEINDYVNERMRALTRFAEWRNTMIRTEKLERLLERSREAGSTILQTMQKEIRMEAERRAFPDRWTPDRPMTLSAEEEKTVVETEARIRKEREASGEPMALLRIVDTNSFIDSVRFQSAKAHFELGRAYEVFDEPNSAIKEYMIVLDKQYIKMDTIKKVFNARTLYTWIEVADRIKAITARDSLIKVLTTEYGETVFASMASRLFLNKAEKDSPAERAYVSAYSTFRSSGISGGKNGLLDVVRSFPSDDVAPRALYAVGIGYEDISRYDSALVYYKRVVKEYPYSRYAEELKPRLAYIVRTDNVPVQPPPQSTPVQQQEIDMENIPRSQVRDPDTNEGELNSPLQEIPPPLIPQDSTIKR